MAKNKKTPQAKKHTTAQTAAQPVVQPVAQIEEVKETPQKRQKTEIEAPKLLFTRSGKVDFTTLFTQHRAEMMKSGCQVDQIIKVR